MKTLAVDFSTECDALHELLREHGHTVFELQTQFKGWTINDILLHLHHWNIAAALAVFEPEAFEEALDHIGITFEAYLDDGHDLEDDDEESVGTDYLASWVLYEPFDDRREAKDFLDRLIEDCSVALSELE